MADVRGTDSRRLKTVRDVSAGGVAFRHGQNGIEVVLVGRREPERWVLPKGTPNRGESLDQTAVREVSEESGIQVRLIRPLHDHEYDVAAWFPIDEAERRLSFANERAVVAKAAAELAKVAAELARSAKIADPSSAAS